MPKKMRAFVPGTRVSGVLVGTEATGWEVKFQDKEGEKKVPLPVEILRNSSHRSDHAKEGRPIECSYAAIAGANRVIRIHSLPTY